MILGLLRFTLLNVLYWNMIREILEITYRRTNKYFQIILLKRYKFLIIYFKFNAIKIINNQIVQTRRVMYSNLDHLS